MFNFRESIILLLGPTYKPLGYSKWTKINKKDN